jgi:flavin reductase (DIM6/NTAB) family NADH-FMN oxidoreductase RutF
MAEPTTGDLSNALAHMPTTTYVLTSAYDGERAGVLVEWVAPAANEPLLVSVSVLKGHSIEPLIRDSRAFALCRVDPADRLILKKFAVRCAPDERSDPFDSMPVRTLKTGSPVIERSAVALDCEVVRHFDLEADHELYVGHVVAARVEAGD